MKRVYRFLCVAGIALLAGIVLLPSCERPGNGSGRRGGNGEIDVPGDNTVKMTVNPYWQVAYEGRGPVLETVTENGESFDFTYMVDKVKVTSTDSEKYYVAVVDKKSFENGGKNFYSFCSKDIEDVKALEKQQGVSFLRSGTHTETFNLLDDGGGEFYAIVYGVGSDGNLTGSYAYSTFSTKAVEAQETNNWNVVYNGRYAGTDENGFQYHYDEVSVIARNNESYYVDIISNKFLNDNFGGDLMAYFKAVSDNLWGSVAEDGYFSDLCFGDNPSLLTGTWDITFNRLYPGNYYAIAFGLDADGNPTGRYSMSEKIVVAEQTPTADFSKWLGRWRVSSKQTVLDDGSHFEVKDGSVSYDLEITNLDSNYEYEIKGWEQGRDKDPDLQYDTHTIFASYDAPSGRFLISSQYITTMTYTNDGVETYYDDYLLGKFTYRQGISSYLSILLTEGLGIAVGEFDESGNASVGGLRVKNVDVDGDNMDVDIIAMQFYQVPHDTEDTGLYYFSEKVPAFPLTLTRISGGSPSVAARSMEGGVREESVRAHMHRASRSKAHGGMAPGGNISSRKVEIRPASGSQVRTKSAVGTTRNGGGKVLSIRRSYRGATAPVR